ncbi:hypothetical protein IQE94_03030 [Synechocystis sp. PCC 7339]|uniref:hypothetical protein n=1 Tax=unclassified Synechocystis TaxID=2640012 RepID=UPI001BAFBD3F|nr:MULTISPECIES: hypothetical protein [unclassified Synechocystis]QUS61136.1 hypothetical protein HTZ78_10965 [Synechocystis sp. PCC 7338]UAJ73318.1 hypothetical protein IQE94_03030 [Synechocystis sp. PCC 7339]
MAASGRCKQPRNQWQPRHWAPWFGLWTASLTILPLAPSLAQSPALPPPDDIPEEILRTEIILEGRSPVDGEPLTATEYAELMEALAENPNPPQLSPRIRHLVFLLRVRKFFRTFLPFL